MTTLATETRFKIEDQAAAKGWKLLAWMVAPSGAIICLCNVGGHQPFVTHKFNSADGGFYYGNYHAMEIEARHDFYKRAAIAY